MPQKNLLRRPDVLCWVVRKGEREINDNVSFFAYIITLFQEWHRRLLNIFPLHRLPHQKPAVVDIKKLLLSYIIFRLYRRMHTYNIRTRCIIKSDSSKSAISYSKGVGLRYRKFKFIVLENIPFICSLFFEMALSDASLQIYIASGNEVINDLITFHYCF